MTRRAAALLLLILVACGLPRDPEGTLERVTGSSMRVGVVASEPWVVDTTEPRGVEVELVESLARELDAEVEWVPGSEAEVFEQLELGHLDLAIGGFTADNPWASKVSFTQPYYVLGQDEHVVAVPHGENAWIVKVERFLRGHLHLIPALLREHAS